MVSILVVTGDAAIAGSIAAPLRAQGMAVTVEATSAAGLQRLGVVSFDLVLVDWALEGGTAAEFCTRARPRLQGPLVAIVPAYDEKQGLAALAAGADDCLTKPLVDWALVARVKTLARAAPAGAPTLEVGALRLDRRSQRAFVRGLEVPLTHYEFDLLRVLAERAGEVLSREELMERAKGSTDDSFDRSIDVHISRLRTKLGDDSRHPRLLKTVRGVGYTLVR